MNLPKNYENRNKGDDVTRVMQEKLIDALTPGLQIEFDPMEADMVGAFMEDALSEEDALDSSLDLPEVSSTLHTHIGQGELL